jgi:hypothetical protein
VSARIRVRAPLVEDLLHSTRFTTVAKLPCKETYLFRVVIPYIDRYSLYSRSIHTFVAQDTCVRVCTRVCYYSKDRHSATSQYQSIMTRSGISVALRRTANLAGWCLLLWSTGSGTGPTFSANAQFACTFAAGDEPSCIAATADAGAHCVWCQVTSFGFCVTETQAEGMEQSLPGVECERYQGDDDDAAPQTDDDSVAPTTDDNVVPTDDAIPDDFWKCLKAKTEEACSGDCVWCDTKGGFGLCMTGPAAENAEESDWFTCKQKSQDALVRHDTTPLQDPYDSSCVLAYLEDPTQEGCTSAMDEDGNACEWCDLAGVTNLCLNEEQAEAGAQLGITCDASSATTTTMLRKQAAPARDPYDPSCLVAFLQDQSQESCSSAIDQDGTPCEFCSLSGALDLCLTKEQADAGAALGIICTKYQSLDVVEEVVEDDPYDPSCLMAFLQDASKESCTTAVDQDGAPCQWCDLSGISNLCLTASQGDMAQQFGITCEPNADLDAPDAVSVKVEDAGDPYDPSCALAFFQDQSKEACINAIDEDGNACEFCTLQNALALCLTEEQAQVGEGIGISCEKEEADLLDQEDAVASDLYDSSCVLAFLSDQSRESCYEALDQDSAPCKFCSLSGVVDLCLTKEQAAMAAPLGITCDEHKQAIEVQESSGASRVGELRVISVQQTSEVQVPSDFWECLENYEEDGCNQAACTWCSSEVGMGFCLADPAARALAECNFFDCDYSHGGNGKAESQEKNDSIIAPYDTNCLNAGMQAGNEGEAVCADTTDLDGNSCVWCDAAGVFGICLSSEQASQAGQFLTCEANTLSVAAE